MHFYGIKRYTYIRYNLVLNKLNPINIRTVQCTIIVVISRRGSYFVHNNLITSQISNNPLHRSTQDVGESHVNHSTKFEYYFSVIGGGRFKEI
jgi:hypothetical protein